MTEDRTFAPGMVRLYRMPHAEGDRSAQVGTGVDPETGETVVFVRMGRLVSAMTPEGAAELASGLAIEAAYAMTQRGERRVKDDPDLPPWEDRRGRRRPDA
jgi:hypothetical protein